MDDREPLFLGLDLSTQQLKAILISEDTSVVQEAAVNFSKDLPHYGTVNGAIRGPDEGEVTSPVAMWLEALDLLLQRMKDAGVDFGSIRAVSGAGQVSLLSMSASHFHELTIIHGHSNTGRCIGLIVLNISSLVSTLPRDSSLSSLPVHSPFRMHPFGKTRQPHESAVRSRTLSEVRRLLRILREAGHMNASLGPRLNVYDT